MHSVTGSLNKNWISKKGKIEEKISNFHGEESNCCRVDELAVVCSMSSLRSMAVLSSRAPQSPRGFSALARLYYLARPTKTAMLRRLFYVIQAHHLFKKWLHVFIFHDSMALLFKIHYGILEGFNFFLGDSLGFASSPRGFQGFS